MRVGVSGTHGTGKSTLVEELRARLAGHVPAGEPYILLEEEGYEFEFPPAADDFRALVRRSTQMLSSAGPRVIFDRTPLDYLAYLIAMDADFEDEASQATLRSAMSSLDLLVITPITAETEQILPAAELPGLQAAMNEALLELVYQDPLQAWRDVPVIELSGPLNGRVEAVLRALGI
jgi:predicted ATPase